ncbi:hypothetical protein [Streptomyces toxytricini]|uniref:Integral membrane protein n=1 Tax=Streptomyces toxytricini TaxID=67369 RepID=A0ABW8EJP7_STRT5
MIIVALVLLLLAFLAAVVPGAVAGYAFVAVSRRLPAPARIALLPVAATGPAGMWVALMDRGDPWRPAFVLFSFLTAVVSGAAFLVREGRMRRAAAVPASAGPSW